MLPPTTDTKWALTGLKGWSTWDKRRNTTWNCATLGKAASTLQFSLNTTLPPVQGERGAAGGSHIRHWGRHIMLAQSKSSINKVQVTSPSVFDNYITLLKVRLNKPTGYFSYGVKSNTQTAQESQVWHEWPINQKLFVIQNYIWSTLFPLHVMLKS